MGTPYIRGVALLAPSLLEAWLYLTASLLEAWLSNDRLPIRGLA